jgi:signal transduction histidine kinase
VNKRLPNSHAFASDAISGNGRFSVAHPELTLLVVDDDNSVRHALWVTFREYYNVKVAESGPKALELFRKQSADVVILDIRMPGMDGLQVLKELKAIDPDIEVILLSGYETIEYVREAMRLGASEYITKPYEVDSLRSSVEGAMARRETARKTASYAKRLSQLQTEIHHQQVREELARTRNEIYASIIHDINGPLTVIAGYVELMQVCVAHAEVLEADQVHGLRQQAQSIAKQVSNCIELSRRYLGFLEGTVASKSQAAVNELFYDVAELLKAHPQVKAKELVIHPFESEVVAAIHRTDLLQILLNLTINALQASAGQQRVELYAKEIPSGGAKGFTQVAPGVHLIRAPEFDESLPMVAISIRDFGPGIPPQLFSRVFEPYFTTKAPGQGTGLGLAIVRRLVTMARGAVHLYSHLGEGTVFTVCIPVVRENTSPAT